MSYIGIDIGTQLTKVVEIRPGHPPVLMNALIFSTPYSKTTPKIVDGEETLNQIVKNFGLKRLRDFQIGISLSSSSLRTEIFTLPEMSIQELRLAAINEAKREMIPQVSPEKAIFDCLLLGRKTTKEPIQLEVLVARCEKEEVEEKIRIFERQGLFLSLISAAPFSIVNLLPEDFWKKEENIVFINIGFSSIDFIIARERRVRFLRNVGFGVNDAISIISEALAIPWEEGLQRLYEYGIPSLSASTPRDRVAIAEEIMREKYEAKAEGRNTEREIILLEMKMALEPHIKRIITELRRSFVAYRKQEEIAGGVEKIFFTGGGSQIKNLVSEISKEIGGVCSILDPFQYVKPSEKISGDLLKQGPSFATACGLALTFGIKEKERIDFLPLPLRRRKKVSRIRMATMIACGFLFSLFFVGYISLLFTARIIKLSLLELKSQIEDLAPLVDEEVKLRQLMERTRGTFAAIESLEKENVAFDQLLIQLACKIPKELTLSKVHFQKKKDKPGEWEMKMNGFITADYENACKVLEDFKANLKDLRFKNISSSPLELEPVSPLTVGEKVILTEVKEREFALTADLEVLTSK